MAAIKIVRRKNKQRKDGTAPLAIRISKDYKTNYKFLGQYVLEKHWDERLGRVKSSHPNSKRLNNFLIKKLAEFNDVVLTSSDDLTSEQVKTKATRQLKRESFFKVAAERIENKYKAGTYSVAKLELSILHNIEEFVNLPKTKSKTQAVNDIRKRRKERVSQALKSKNFFFEDVEQFKKNTALSFREITSDFLDKYKLFCKNYLEQSPRTIANQLTYIRTLFNMAIDKDIVESKYYPFVGKNEKIKVKSGHKIGLTIEEVDRIEDLELEEDTLLWHTRNVWLTAFYFAGIRVSDVLKLKWSDFIDGRLFYTMNKNDKTISLKVHDKAKSIIEAYEQKKAINESDFIFPFIQKANPDDSFDIFTKSRSATWLLNKYLKEIAQLAKIDKKLTMHIARHSFGNIAGDSIHPLMLQKLYRHSDLKTTINYQANFIHKEADEALDAVINF